MYIKYLLKYDYVHNASGTHVTITYALTGLKMWSTQFFAVADCLRQI